MVKLWLWFLLKSYTQFYNVEQMWHKIANGNLQEGPGFYSL